MANAFGELEAEGHCHICDSPLKEEWVACPSCGLEVGAREQPRIGEPGDEMSRALSNQQFGEDLARLYELGKGLVSSSPLLGGSLSKYSKSLDAFVNTGQGLERALGRAGCEDAMVRALWRGLAGAGDNSAAWVHEVCSNFSVLVVQLDRAEGGG